jgi:hypothetical protein
VNLVCRTGQPLRDGVALSRCESCHRQTAEVIESRRTRLACRRRKCCLVCKHRFTEYELSAVEFKRLSAAATALDAIHRALGTATPPAPDPEPEAPVPCASCRYATASGCSFDYPEYGTPDAADCPMLST